MSEPFIGEIRMFAGNFAPRGWAYCDGQLLEIDQHDALFELYGTTYGGDGRTTFGLPDLRGRVPIHHGSGPGLSPYAIGHKAGQENTTLTSQQLPSHTHRLKGSTANGPSPNPGGAVLASSSVLEHYAAETADASMAAQSIGTVGGSQRHTNVQPFLAIHFIVALVGIYPSR